MQIQGVLRRAKIRQYAVAAKMGFSPKYLSQLLNARSNLRLNRVQELLDHADAELLFCVVAPPPPHGERIRRKGRKSLTHEDLKDLYDRLDEHRIMLWEVSRQLTHARAAHQKHCLIGQGCPTCEALTGPATVQTTRTEQ
jgi:transcriptional regulator with XRE-family HTH domain